MGHDLEFSRRQHAAVRASFDRLAELDTAGWNHNAHYHGFLLRQVPEGVAAALEVGCGAGQFARLLARRAGQVLAIDFSQGMIRAAQAAEGCPANLHFEECDFMAREFAPASFDCIVSIAALHHMPVRAACAKMAQLLKPGGLLLVLDLYRAATPGDFASCAVAFALSRWVRLCKSGRWVEPPALRAAWRDHEHLDRHMSLGELRAALRDVLPGAQIRRRVFFRYALRWTKPA